MDTNGQGAAGRKPAAYRLGFLQGEVGALRRQLEWIIQERCHDEGTALDLRALAANMDKALREVA